MKRSGSSVDRARGPAAMTLFYGGIASSLWGLWCIYHPLFFLVAGVACVVASILIHVNRGVGKS